LRIKHVHIFYITNGIELFESLEANVWEHGDEDSHGRP